MANKVKAVLIGGTGYGGAEILRRLLFHPHVEVARITSVDNIGKKVGDVHFNLAGLTDLAFQELPPAQAVAGMDVAFLAMPHKTTAKVVLDILASGVRIVDLSGDFRLRDAASYAKYYGVDHPAPKMLTEGAFTYGLPELNREALRTARYIASPGCFATTIALGLMPLARAGLLSGPIHTVAATGSSGSGANPQITTHHPLRAANLRTYKPLEHQHVPEILQTLRLAGGKEDMALEFVPVSAPLPRGIFASSLRHGARLRHPGAAHGGVEERLCERALHPHCGWRPSARGGGGVREQLRGGGLHAGPGDGGHAPGGVLLGAGQPGQGRGGTVHPELQRDDGL